MSSACSPVSGCEMRSFSVSTPMPRAYATSSACSASMNAADAARALRLARWRGGRAWSCRSTRARRSRRSRPRGIAADAGREIERQRARGDRGDRLGRLVVPERHDRALSELLLDLVDDALQGPHLVCNLLDDLRRHVRGSFPREEPQRAACRARLRALPGISSDARCPAMTTTCPGTAQRLRARASSRT